MTLDVLINGKPITFDEPEAIAFDLDDDPLLEFDGARHDLPAGAVLVWTGRELHLYPASHPVRLAVRGAGLAPRDLQEGGTRLRPGDEPSDAALEREPRPSWGSPWCRDFTDRVEDFDVGAGMDRLLECAD